MPDLGEMLSDGRVHVVDGAMGTMLYARGVFMNVCYDELNATDPDLVEDVHEQYVRAGAQIVETNTFGANPVKLSSYGLDERTEELNAQAARLALRAAAGRACVAGAVGPLGVRVEPLGPTSLAEAREYFGRQVDGLLEGGVEGFFLETFSDLAEMEQAFLAVRSRCDLPVVVQATVGEECATGFGATVEQAARAAEEWGADAAGLNCSVGPAVILDGVERMAATTRLPLSAQPNAGLPRAVGDRKMYLAGPEYMAMYARRLIRAGARLVGGCCGTTPEHVRRIREEVAAIQPRTPPVRVVRDLADRAVRAGPPLRARSRLGARLDSEDFVVAVRTTPPRGWNASEMAAERRRLAEAGAHVAVVHEDRAAARMSTVAAAALAAGDGVLEPVLHYTCRGRTLAEMIGDLLGAAASGARNLLLATGDPHAGGPYPAFGAGLEIDAIGLANVVAGLNTGVDPAGNEVGEPTGFVAGVVVNQGARDRAQEVERFHWKVEAGVHYAVARSVFDADHLLAFLDEARAATTDGAGVPVLATIRLLENATQAEFLQNEVPGVHVPERVVERMRRAEAHGPRHAWAEGLEVAREVVDALGRRVAGVQVVAPSARAEAFVGEIKQALASGDRVPACAE